MRSRVDRTSVRFLMSCIGAVALLTACMMGATGPESYSIDGRIVDQDGHGIASVIIAITGDTNAEVITDLGGFWRATIVGNVVIAPGRTGYSFIPAYRQTHRSGDDLDFVGRRLTAPGPVAIAGMIADLDTAEAGVLLLLDALGIGVYTPSGQQVQAGSERSEADFWLHDFQVVMLVSLAHTPPAPFAGLVDALSGAGLDMDADELLSLYRSVYAVHDNTFLVRFLDATGLDLAVQPDLTGLQQWLLLLDTIIAPNRTEPADPLSPAVHRGVSCLISGPALSGWGFIHGAAADHLDLVTAEGAFRAVNAPLFRSSLDIKLTVAPETVSEGTCGPGEPATLTVEVISSFVPTSVPVACGVLAGVQLPGIAGHLEGAEVEWSLPPVLDERGTVRLPGGSPYPGHLPTVTDSMGQTILIYEPQESEQMGLGYERLESALIKVTVDVVPALRLAGIHDVLFLSLLSPVPEFQLMHIAWYLPGPVQSSGMTTGGGWTSEGRSENQLGPEGQWTTQSTVTGPYGTLTGSTAFTMPPRPLAQWWEEDRFLPWESEPYQLTMSGQQTIGDVVVDTDATYDLVSLIRCESDAPHFDVAACTVTTTTKVITPDGSYTQTDTGECEPDDPRPIVNAP